MLHIAYMLISSYQSVQYSLIKEDDSTIFLIPAFCICSAGKKNWKHSNDTNV